MVVAKRQGKEKPIKIEQRKVPGPQVEQTAPLASPIYNRVKNPKLVGVFCP